MFSVTSTIDRSSSSTVIGKTSLGESETLLISDCPEKAIIPKTIANPATTIPTKIFGFNIKFRLKHILNVDNYYTEKVLVS